MRLATPADREQIERIFNDPAIRANAADGAPPFSASRLVDPSFAVIGEEGCFLAMCVEPSRYIVHTGILPAYRGERAAVASFAALAIAFCETDALELETMVPATTPQARLFARQMGFRYRFTRERLWPARGELHDVAFLSMTVLDWALTGACEGSGAWFHEQMEAKRRALNFGMQGSTLGVGLHIEPHPQDTTHDAVVGVVIEMVRAGRPDKAVAVYNYWARVAGYQQIAIVSRNPLRIDIRQCVLKVEEDQFIVEAPHA